MEKLIDKSFFLSGVTYIPGLEISNGYDESLSANLIDSLNKCIDFYQEEFFIRVLGYDLYIEFSESSDDEKWKDMLSKLIDNDKKISPLANYVYCYYLEENKTQISNAGAVITKKDNMTAMQINHLQTSAWNQMVRKMVYFFNWFINNKSSIEQTNNVCTIAWSELIEETNPYL